MFSQSHLTSLMRHFNIFLNSAAFFVYVEKLFLFVKGVFFLLLASSRRARKESSGTCKKRRGIEKCALQWQGSP